MKNPFKPKSQQYRVVGRNRAVDLSKYTIRLNGRDVVDYDKLRRLEPELYQRILQEEKIAGMRDEAEYTYQAKGLETRYIIYKPYKIYKPHAHASVYLFSVKGTAKIKLADKWLNVSPGQEIKIESGQVHEAVVGQDGWEYIFATTSEEMKRQGL